MNDSGRGRTTLRAAPWLIGLPVVALVGLAGCGSNASPSASSHGGGSALSPQSSPAEALRNLRKAHPVDENPAIEPQLPNFDEIGTAPPAPPVFACSRQPVAFDLSSLRPAATTPSLFWNAWKHANEHKEVPGFVVVYTGTMSGPIIEARVGAVYPVLPGVYSFMSSTPHTGPARATVDPGDPLHVRSYHTGLEFPTAFGTVRNREGFIIAGIDIEGRLDSECHNLLDVVVTMRLPKSNFGQRFGVQTVDEELGHMIEDYDLDGQVDSWIVTMTAPVLEAVKFQL
jgi:hypothetical protein